MHMSADSIYGIWNIAMLANGKSKFTYGNIWFTFHNLKQTILRSQIDFCFDFFLFHWIKKRFTIYNHLPRWYDSSGRKLLPVVNLHTPDAHDVICIASVSPEWGRNINFIHHFNIYSNPLSRNHLHLHILPVLMAVRTRCDLEYCSWYIILERDICN